MADFYSGAAARNLSAVDTQHGKPHGVVRDDQPDAREGQAGPCGVADRPVVPRKPGNAGEGKGPDFGSASEVV